MPALMIEGFEAENIGVCVKDLQKKVLWQNPKSIELCGNQRTRGCEKGCMRNYILSEGFLALSEGGRLLSGMEIGENRFDAFILNNGQKILTLLYPLAEKQRAALASFKGYGISRREEEVLSLVLQGATRSVMIQELHISKATLKTHLNNIYKKVPSEVAKQLQRRAVSRKITEKRN